MPDDTYDKINGNGKRSGYGYEYLQKIAGYTGWNYEYVDCTWENCFDKLKNDELDMIEGISYTEERAENMLFSAIPMGDERYYVYVKLDHTDISSSDTASFHGKKIGVLMGYLSEMVLNEWEKKYNLHTQHVNVSNNEDALKKISNSAGNVENDISGLLTKIDNRAKGIYKLSDSVDSDLSQIKKTLSDSGKLLSKAAKKIRKTTGKLKNAKDGDNSDLKSLIMGNKEDLTSFLATPVQLKTTKLYPIDNYGSSMAPFYSTLSIWIGGIVLVAMLKVNISEKMKKSLRNLQNYQAYFGRYIIFLIVGLMQSTLIALGDLYYLGIQCEHPFLFVFACWFSSIVYVNIIYTLTVSFGDIGKAISVILLVVQVAGAGGTFPIEVAPGFFRAVYPLLPFTHSMAALREAVGGMYEMVYWIELGKLGIFLVISLFVGLVLRRPIIKMNDAFTEKLEETKIM